MGCQACSQNEIETLQIDGFWVIAKIGWGGFSSVFEIEDK